MQFEQPPENIWPLLKRLQGAALQPRTTVERKQSVGPSATVAAPGGDAPARSESDLPARRQSAKHHGLAEGEAESLARDGIDCARRISDQRDIAAAHALQLAGGGQSALLGGRNLRALPAVRAIRETAAKPQPAAIWDCGKSARRTPDSFDTGVT